MNQELVPQGSSHIQKDEAFTFVLLSKNGQQIEQPLHLSAQSDQLLLQTWLYGKAAKTQRAYLHEIARFYTFSQKSFVDLQVQDVQAYMLSDTIRPLKESSQARALAAIKSICSFGARQRMLPFNVAAAVPLPKIEDTLAQRIMTEEDVERAIEMETNPRNKRLLEFLYFTGIRAEELCNLKWKHLQQRSLEGQIQVYGKGKKTRHLLIDADTWMLIWQSKGNASPEDYVFPSRQKSKRIDEQGRELWDYRMDESRVHQIVRKAADRAGIAVGSVSPHWLRHAHATYSLEHGAPISLVMKDMGHSRMETTARYLHVRPTEGTAQTLRTAQKKRREAEK
jgi:integrase/recombinase XerD